VLVMCIDVYVPNPITICELLRGLGRQFEKTWYFYSYKVVRSKTLKGGYYYCGVILLL
jgi:hypothetical protein